jgi:hypothetical protein
VLAKPMDPEGGERASRVYGAGQHMLVPTDRGLINLKPQVRKLEIFGG